MGTVACLSLVKDTQWFLWSLYVSSGYTTSRKVAGSSPDEVIGFFFN
jgi:hypothetical protein